MAVPALNIAEVSATLGMDAELAAEAMRDGLSRYALQLSYDPATKKFTVIGSSAYTQQVIQDIFYDICPSRYLEGMGELLMVDRTYQQAPKVLDETDASGDYRVELVYPDFYDDSPSSLVGRFAHRQRDGATEKLRRLAEKLIEKPDKKDAAHDS